MQLSLESFDAAKGTRGRIVDCRRSSSLAKSITELAGAIAEIKQRQEMAEELHSRTMRIERDRLEELENLCSAVKRDAEAHSHALVHVETEETITTARSSQMLMAHVGLKQDAPMNEALQLIVDHQEQNLAEIRRDIRAQEEAVSAERRAREQLVVELRAELAKIHCELGARFASLSSDDEEHVPNLQRLVESVLVESCPRRDKSLEELPKFRQLVAESKEDPSLGEPSKQHGNTAADASSRVALHLGQLDVSPASTFEESEVPLERDFEQFINCEQALARPACGQAAFVDMDASRGYNAFDSSDACFFTPPPASPLWTAKALRRESSLEVLDNTGEIWVVPKNTLPHSRWRRTSHRQLASNPQTVRNLQSARKPQSARLGKRGEAPVYRIDFTDIDNVARDFGRKKEQLADVAEEQCSSAGTSGPFSNVVVSRNKFDVSAILSSPRRSMIGHDFADLCMESPLAPLGRPFVCSPCSLRGNGRI
mmetsp:Transcript_123795/g.193260  ORF Transcript_123795/g.193260 Transcript_123795/m.193260 type:complete len:484 (+) Transcript_123795:2-1453(+)